MPTGHCVTQQVRLAVPKPRLTWKTAELVDKSVTVILVNSGVQVGHLKTQSIFVTYPGSEGEAMMAVGGTVGRNDGNMTGFAATQQVSIAPNVAMPRKVSKVRHPDSDGILASSLDSETNTLVVRVTGPSVAALAVRGEGDI